MTRPRKVLRGSVPLHLYALAQVRADEVRSACAKPCADCPGPEADDGCLTRKFPAAVAGRADWPFCPQGMLQVRTWQECVELYVAAKVSPIAGFPDDRPAFVQDAMVSLFTAVRNDDERRAKEASKGPAGPNFTGRRTARGG